MWRFTHLGTAISFSNRAIIPTKIMLVDDYYVVCTFREYDKLKKGISFADDDTYEVEKENNVSRSRTSDEELIDMLSNIDEDEVDFTPKKVV